MVQVDHPLYKEDLEMVVPYINLLLEEKKNPKILIIGATGLIGSFLTDAFIYFNANIENNIEIYAMGRSHERLQKRFGYSQMKSLILMEHDIQKPLCCDIEWDYIFHFASYANPEAYVKYPYETITINVLGSRNVIEYARKKKNTKILFTSTMEVYGETDGGLLKEDEYGALNFNKMRSGYPESKRISELMYKSAVSEYQVQCVIARMGYIYGPTMIDSDDKVVAQFIRSAIAGEDIILKSEGLQERTYCYMADAVTGILVALRNGINGGVYNVADKNSCITIKGLAEFVSDEFGIGIQRECLKQPSEKIYHTALSTDKLEALGWVSKINLNNGIRKSIAEYQGGYQWEN